MRKGMASVLSGSIALKGVGAILEIVAQIMITRSCGVSSYGDYSFYIGLADLIFWLLFSGIIKCNTFYLGEKRDSVSSFKRRFYGFFVVPIVLVGIGLGVIIESFFLCLSFIILLFEIVLFDKSSQYLARRRYAVSLLGEYVIGRAVLLVGIVVLVGMDAMSLFALLGAYALQLAVVDCFFLAKHRLIRAEKPVREQKVSIGKLWHYQESDIVTALIGQAPVVLQYVAAGAFSAGLVSVIALVRRVVNFFSGPTAKVFLPEFARFCRDGDKRSAQNLYAQIVRIQMLFVSVASVVLIGFPAVVLNVFNSDLVGYENTLRWTSACFLFATMLGPAGGLLQMAGYEKRVSITKNVSAAIMVAVWIVASSQQLFVLYGICVELILETIVLFVLVGSYFNAMPVSVGTYAKVLTPTVLALALSLFIGSDSVLGAIVVSAGVFLIQVILEYRKGLFRLVKGRKE